MKVISLTTNLGYGNIEISILKGMLLARVPEVKIADLTHDLGLNDVIDAAVILNRHSAYFPAGSIHLFLTTTEFLPPERVIAAKIGEQYYIGPDNGFLTILIKDAQIKNLPTRFIQTNHQEFAWNKTDEIITILEIFSYDLR